MNPGALAYVEPQCVQRRHWVHSDHLTVRTTVAYEVVVLNPARLPLSPGFPSFFFFGKPLANRAKVCLAA